MFLEIVIFMVSKTKTSTILIKFKVRIKGEEGKNYKTLS